MGAIVPRSKYGSEGVEDRRCDACHMPNREDRAQGHRYAPTTTADESTGETIAAPEPAGCIFCGCPELFSGGSLGDMAR